MDSIVVYLRDKHIKPRAQPEERLRGLKSLP